MTMTSGGADVAVLWASGFSEARAKHPTETPIWQLARQIKRPGETPGRKVPLRGTEETTFQGAADMACGPSQTGDPLGSSVEQQEFT